MISKNKLAKLALLQLEQYDTSRYVDGLSNKQGPEMIKRLKWTSRLRVTLLLSFVVGVKNANIILSIPMKVLEFIIWYWVRFYILKLKRNGLRVVAIAGSYGKTSVKNYLYDLLRVKYKVVATPLSFNTVLGIVKCLSYEVDAKTQIFIVEVGAYHMGDITRLLEMVLPDCGILTGIARQHLERFGSFENIIKAKSEIAVYLKKSHGFIVANGADEVVKEAVSKIGGDIIFYDGVGRHEINMAGAKKMALKIGMSSNEIANAKVREVKNRFEMTSDRYGMLVIDDSFSSNDVGFESAVKYLGGQNKYTRILVTPGIVELGGETAKIHEELGKKIVGSADLVILVGRNERTKGIAKGINGLVNIEWIEKTLDFVSLVKKMKLKKEPLVLIENDVTENY